EGRGGGFSRGPAYFVSVGRGCPPWSSPPPPGGENNGHIPGSGRPPGGRGAPGEAGPPMSPAGRCQNGRNASQRCHGRSPPDAPARARGRPATASGPAVAGRG